ncbi:hypothetical protein ACO9S2_17145 [Nitrospira sp. NS4]|uniref:hypothetical protein n=1 Tax=Nitrospira sp. NS4 TaxID=3414498 RepID=UPI003C2E6F19
MTQGLASLLMDCPEYGTQEAQMSQEKEALTGPQNGSDSVVLSRVLPKPRRRVGIMVFSSSCKMLYANQTAFEFLKLLNWREHGHATDGALPGSVADLFDRMRLALACWTGNVERQRLEARQLLVDQDEAVLLQAFGLRDQIGGGGSRVVIRMEAVIRPVGDQSSDATLSFI